MLNLDLEDFFPSFNFGRVRGFFIKDKNFSLHKNVATIIAQIACHDNELPQGSPCSPIISNLIGHLLDARLARFAKAHKCTYSRYADDITFSTSQKDFPTALAEPVPGSPSKWRLSEQLVAKIEHSGFRVNHIKTRMQIRGARQVTTGLLVNEKVNVVPEYYRTARAMCHSLFSKGTYFRVVPSTLAGGAPSDPPKKITISESDHLAGILAHIHHVRDQSNRRAAREDSEDRKEKIIHLRGFRKLYYRFLFYRNFVVPPLPLIITEGKTDKVYLRCAIRSLVGDYPRLGEFVGGKFRTLIRFMNYSRTVQDVLKLGGGTGALAQLIINYKKIVQKFGHKPLPHPVIILIDNDDGANTIFNTLKNNGGPTVTHSSTDPFYHICENLYLVKTPERASAKSFPKSCIEDLFDSSVLEVEIDGKKFDPSKEHDAPDKYGKAIFAEKVVRPMASTIDFSRFAQLLDRIVAVLEDYKIRAGGSAAT